MGKHTFWRALLGVVMLAAVSTGAATVAAKDAAGESPLVDDNGNAAPQTEPAPLRNVFDKVKTRFNSKAGPLVDKDADLVFDDDARKLIVKNDQKPLEVGYGDIQRVVFDVSRHMRGGGLGDFIGAGSGVVNIMLQHALQNRAVQDYWCFIQYKSADGSIQPYMLEIDKASSQDAIGKMQAVLGDKVEIAEFAEQAEAIDRKTLPDVKSKHKLRVASTHPPVPAIRPDKALLVVVCPRLAARKGGGIQNKLHANDHVVAVNTMGTYGFAYLDPGEYLLATESRGGASGFRMRLEAGEDYYFLQNAVNAATTSLSRQTKELVMYELSGSFFADWQRKAGSGDDETDEDSVQAAFGTEGVDANGNVVSASAGSANPCGAVEIDFSVKTDKGQHPIAKSQPGKAIVYVLRKPGMTGALVQTKLAMDGAWMGANQRNGYFFFAAEPGAHSFCSVVKAGSSILQIELEPDKTYYLEQKIQLSTKEPTVLTQLSEGEGLRLLGKNHYSVIEEKK
ncbi:MAG: DUF2846 domain-containing protein [Acidobacteriota bacterium]|jgi:hypothetical protein|nr:DUF2846 domain-containing protein [Acidobacteriota bacterium]